MRGVPVTQMHPLATNPLQSATVQIPRGGNTARVYTVLEIAASLPPANVKDSRSYNFP